MTEYEENNGNDSCQDNGLNLNHDNGDFNALIQNHESQDSFNGSNLEDDTPLRKLFVGGLSWETTEKDLRDYFCNYGEILELNLKMDPVTQRSRCFAFILYKEKESIAKIACQTHELNGKTIDPKPARIKGIRDPILKVFVGGMNPETTEESIRSHFEAYGRVTEIDLPVDRSTGMRRGFCFVGFDNEHIVDTCCEQAKQDVGGKKCDIKKAIPPEEKEKNQQYQNGGFDASRGRGRGRGRGASYGGPPPSGQYNYQQSWGQPQGYYDYYGNWVNYDYNQSSGGYDYSQYPGYDYSSYYNQGWSGYSGYDQSSYYSQPQVPPQGQTQPPAQQPPAQQPPPQQQYPPQQQPYQSPPTYTPQQSYPPQQQQSYPSQQAYSSQPPSYGAPQTHEAPGKDSTSSSSSYHPYARS